MLTLIKRTGGIDTSDANAGPYQILIGYSGYVDDERIEGIMPNRGAYTYSLPVNTSHNIPDGWHNGEGKITQSLVTQDTVTVIPGTTAKLVCAANRWTIGNLWIKGDPDLVAGNVKIDENIFGVTGTYRGCVTTDATVTDAQILTGYSAYGSAGTKIAGTMANNETTNHTLAVDGSYTIPKGWHNGNGKVTQSLTTQAGWTATPGTGNILLCSASRWTTGDIWVKGDGNLVAGNIKKGVTIFGVTGTNEGVFDSSGKCQVFSNGSPTGKIPCSQFTRYIGSTPTGSCTSWFSGGSHCAGQRNWLLGWQIDTAKLSGYNWSMTVSISGVYKDQWRNNAQSTDGPYKWSWFAMNGQYTGAASGLHSTSFWGYGGARNSPVSKAVTGNYNPTMFGFWRSSGSNDSYWCWFGDVIITKK